MYPCRVNILSKSLTGLGRNLHLEVGRRQIATISQRVAACSNKPESATIKGQSPISSHICTAMNRLPPENMHE